jgi:hypothetical protein
MVPGRLVNVRLSPGIDRNLFGKVRPIPVVGARGLLPQGFQPFFRRRIPPDIEPKSVESRAEVLDLGFCSDLFSSADLSLELRPHQSGQQPDNRDHHQNFKKSETFFLLSHRFFHNASLHSLKRNIRNTRHSEQDR